MGEKKDLFRYILGYLLGGTLFFVVIPSGLYLCHRLFDRCLPFVLFDRDPLRILLTAFLGATGLVFAAWSNISLLMLGKGGPTEGLGVAVSPRTKRLVIAGPYRYTRNPMVFGTYSCYMALALFFNSPACLIALALFLIAIVSYLKLSEEQRLARDFGDEFAAYRRSVSMIIPLPPRRVAQ